MIDRFNPGGLLDTKACLCAFADWMDENADRFADAVAGGALGWMVALSLYSNGNVPVVSLKTDKCPATILNALNGMEVARELTRDKFMADTANAMHACAGHMRANVDDVVTMLRDRPLDWGVAYMSVGYGIKGMDVDRFGSVRVMVNGLKYDEFPYTGEAR